MSTDSPELLTAIVFDADIADSLRCGIGFQSVLIVSYEFVVECVRALLQRVTDGVQSSVSYSRQFIRLALDIHMYVYAHTVR